MSKLWNDANTKDHGETLLPHFHHSKSCHISMNHFTAFAIETPSFVKVGEHEAKPTKYVSSLTLAPLFLETLLDPVPRALAKQSFDSKHIGTGIIILLSQGLRARMKVLRSWIINPPNCHFQTLLAAELLQLVVAKIDKALNKSAALPLP